MKYAALLMLLVVVVSCETGTELPPSDNNGDSDVIINDQSDHTDVLVLLLKQLADDVADLSTKTDNLQQAMNGMQVTTDNLKMTMGSLSLRVRNIEDDVTDLVEFKNNVENDMTTKDQEIQKQITDLSSDMEENISLLTKEDGEIRQLVSDLSQDVQANVTLLTKNDGQIKDQLTDLSTKEQSDYDQVESDISVVRITVQENYQELNVNTGCDSTTMSNGFYYEYIETEYPWLVARGNCISKGGDLVYQGFNDSDFRHELICDHFNLCSSGHYQQPWIGMTRLYSSDNSQWEYLDKTQVLYSDQLWYSTEEYEDAGEDCAQIGIVDQLAPGITLTSPLSVASRNCGLASPL